MALKHVIAKAHVVKRWKQRVGTDKTAEEIEEIFRKNNYTRLEFGHSGKLIVSCVGYVWVISRTRKSLIIHTVYCSLEEYKEKCPHREKAQQCYEVYRWEKQQRRTGR